MSDEQGTTRKAPPPPPRPTAMTSVAPTQPGSGSNLVKEFRSSASGQEPASEAELPATPVPVTISSDASLDVRTSVVESEPPAAVQARPVQRPQFVEPRPEEPRTPKEDKVTVRLPFDLRRRLRAAYEVTRYAEGHRTFSEFATDVFEREVTRLERTYNGGEPWEGGEVPLQPGRPLSF